MFTRAARPQHRLLRRARPLAHRGEPLDRRRRPRPSTPTSSRARISRCSAWPRPRADCSGRRTTATPGAHPVVVLGHRFYRERFGGDPQVVGRTVSVNGHPMSVVGVAPPGFKGVEVGTRDRPLRAPGHADAGAAHLEADPRRLALALAHRDGAPEGRRLRRAGDARASTSSTRSSCRRTSKTATSTRPRTERSRTEFLAEEARPSSPAGAARRACATRRGRRCSS